MLHLSRFLDMPNWRVAVSKWSCRILFPLLSLVIALGTCGAALAHETVTTSTVGTLKVERQGDHGQPVILIPGLQGGPWVWQRTIDQLQKDHVVYAVTLAGFDGVPAPGGDGNLLDRADASLLRLIEQQKIVKPVLIGHSLGGTLALRFAGEHAELISGVVAVDGLPIFPGMERVDAARSEEHTSELQSRL